MRRVHRRNVHGDAARQLDVATLQFDQHADTAAVHIGGDVVGAVDTDQATHLQVFADLGDHRSATLFDGLAAVELDALERFGIGSVRVQCGIGHDLGEGQEVLVLGDEVGLGVDFDQHGLAAGLGGGDAAFGGNAVSLLVGLGQARLAQPLGRGVDVACVFDECLLALHHAGAGALAQFLDQGSSDFHGITSYGRMRAAEAIPPVGDGAACRRPRRCMQ